MKKHLLAAAVLALGSASVLAAGPFSLGPLDDSSAVIGRVVGSGVFVDTYTFSLSDPLSDLTGGAYSLFVSGLQAELFDSTFASYGVDTNLLDGFSFAGLSSGTYALQIAGFSTSPSGVYGGVVNATPVPEPETYAMFLAGLGAIGFMAARRRNRG